MMIDGNVRGKDVTGMLPTDMIRLNLVKSAKFQKYFFWCFFNRNDLSRVDLIIKVVFNFNPTSK